MMEQYAQMKSSGVSWIQDVPSNWGIRVLFQLVDQVKNKNKDLAEQNLLSLSYGKIKRKDINNPEGLLPESFDGYNIIEAYDIVLRLTDLQNDHTSLRVAQAKERGIITSAYTTLRPTSIVNPKYVYYVLHTYDLIKGFYGMGAGVRQGLNYDEVKNIKVPFPPIDVQDKIVAFLDNQVEQIDCIIEEAKTSIEEYKKWKSSIIFEAVTKGTDNSVELRDSGIEWARAIPKHWKVGAFKLLAILQRGKDLLSDSFIQGSYPVVGSSGIMGYHNEMTVEGPTVIIGRSGSTGKLHYIDSDCWAHNTAICIKDNKENYVKYLYYLLHVVDMEFLSTKTAVPTLDRKRIQNYIVPFTENRKEQIDIANFLDDKTEKIDYVIREKEALLKDLEYYKRSLIYEAVTGKRKVV